MNSRSKHITVCICTYQRLILLKRLLTDLCRTDTRGLFTFSIVVVDNAQDRSARQMVLDFASSSPVETLYFSEPRRSISYARNKTLEHAKGDFIAFIDDDEFPDENWLVHLFRSCNSFPVAGVLGPVRPHFDNHAPDWVRKGGFYDRLEHVTGYAIPWQECRTGNVLFKSEIIFGLDPVFSPEFGTGGSDVDFFRRMMAAGHKFVWCNEAVVHEIVPPQRWNRRVLMSRALLRGRNSIKHPQGRCWNVVKALVAVPLYALALPILYFAGHHLFMRYLIKLCDHFGRLMALVGINPIHERPM